MYYTKHHYVLRGIPRFYNTFVLLFK